MEKKWKKKTNSVELGLGWRKLRGRNANYAAEQAIDARFW